MENLNLSNQNGKKTQNFKIKSKVGKKAFKSSTLKSRELLEQASFGHEEVNRQPYMKRYIPDAKGKLSSLYQLCHRL